MNQVLFEVLSNRQIARATYELRLAGDAGAIKVPGQFVNIRIDGCYLRRPISVCDWGADSMTLIYKIVGEGTEKLALTKAGDRLDILTGLGNGYDTSPAGERPLLIGGGVGVPPLFALCKKLIGEGRSVKTLLGFNTADEVFYADRFAAEGATVTVTTVDGSFGTRGYVTDVIGNLDYTYFYACGPMPMFRAVEKTVKGRGQYSLEERMGCGFGACMGCTCKTLTGARRICRDGPVFLREEIIWN